MAPFLYLYPKSNMKVIYKKEPVTVIKLTLAKPEYLNKPVIVQVKIKYKDGATDYADPRDIIWEPNENKQYE